MKLPPDIQNEVNAAIKLIFDRYPSAILDSDPVKALRQVRDRCRDQWAQQIAAAGLQNVPDEDH